MILCRSEDRLQAMSVSLLHLHIIADEVDEFQAGGLPSEFPDRWLRWFFQGMPQIIFQAHVSRKFHPFVSDVHLTQHHFNSISTTKILPVQWTQYGPARFQAAPHGMSHHLLDDSPVMLQPLRRRWGIAQIRACAPEGLDGTAGAAKV